jgi:hypothetical protein
MPRQPPHGFENIGPECQIMAVTYDGTYVLRIFHVYARHPRTGRLYADIRGTPLLRHRPHEGGAPLE